MLLPFIVLVKVLPFTPFIVVHSVVDSSTDRIVFYNTEVFADGNPTKEEHVRGIIEHLFKDFKK